MGYLKTTKEVASEMKEKKDNFMDNVKEQRELMERKKEEWSDAWQKFAKKSRKKQAYNV